MNYVWLNRSSPGVRGQGSAQIDRAGARRGTGSDRLTFLDVLQFHPRKKYEVERDPAQGENPMPGGAYGRAQIYFFFFFFTYLEYLKDSHVSAKAETEPPTQHRTLLGLPYGPGTCSDLQRDFSKT